MIIQSFAVGMFLTNCYIVGCIKTREAIIIDPGFNHQNENERICEFVDENNLMLKYIVNTHGHPDHTCGNKTAKDEFQVPILIHEQDAHMLGKSSNWTVGFFGFEKPSPPADTLLHEGDILEFGRIKLKVIHTPGHTRGSISLLGEKEVFTGDTLFSGSIGRTDFPESSETDMKLSLEKLARLPSHFMVYPGHGSMTRIDKERRSNPFLRLLLSQSSSE